MSLVAHSGDGRDTSREGWEGIQKYHPSAKKDGGGGVCGV